MFGDLNVEKGDRQLAIPLADVVEGRLRWPRRLERDAQRLHLVDGRCQAVRRPIGQPVIVIVDAGEGGGDRPQAVIAFEKCGQHVSIPRPRRLEENEGSRRRMGFLRVVFVLSCLCGHG